MAEHDDERLGAQARLAQADVDEPGADPLVLVRWQDGERSQRQDRRLGGPVVGHVVDDREEDVADDVPALDGDQRQLRDEGVLGGPQLPDHLDLGHAAVGEGGGVDLEDRPFVHADLGADVHGVGDARCDGRQRRSATQSTTREGARGTAGGGRSPGPRECDALRRWGSSSPAGVAKRRS